LIADKLSSLLDKRFTEDDLKDCFLIEIKVSQDGKKIEVFLDSDTTLDLYRCRVISRHLEHHIEENGWLSDDYTLDVSSPGVGKPLKHHRQYVKNKGRNIDVKTMNGDRLKGKLTLIGEEHIEVTEQIKSRKKKKNQPEPEVYLIQLTDIKEAKIKVSFN